MGLVILVWETTFLLRDFRLRSEKKCRGIKKGLKWDRLWGTRNVSSTYVSMFVETIKMRRSRYRDFVDRTSYVEEFFQLSSPREGWKGNEMGFLGQMERGVYRRFFNRVVTHTYK